MNSRRSRQQHSLLRLLLYALGASPQEFYLLPNAQGWISIKELLRALEHDPQAPPVRESFLREAAAVLAHDQLEITPSHIRAKVRQPLELAYAVTPPGHLYYGARRKSYAHVLENGLQAGEQQGALIFSPDPDLALRLAQRRGPEHVLLTIQARKAQEQGVVFDLLGSDMYLCQYLPSAFLMGPALPETPGTKAKKPAPPLPPQSGSFTLTPENPKPYRQKGLKKEIKWKRERRTA